MTDTAIADARPMTRWKASGIHLLISAAVAGAALLVMLTVWYPPPLFTAEGGNDLLFILVAVDVVIGPLITLIIFKSGKPSLRFDLAAIGMIQACALAYGCYVMFVARPVYIAFIVDQFEIVRAAEIDSTDLAQAKDALFRSLPLAGPQTIAIAIPQDLNVLKGLLADAMGDGKVVQHLPRYYVPYADQQRLAVDKGRPLDALKSGDLADGVKKYVAESGRAAADLRVLPLGTRRGLGAVLIDARTGDVLRLLAPPKT